MPVMDIYPSESLLPIQLAAYMLHPEDEESRDTFVAHKLAEMYLQNAKEDGEDEVHLSVRVLEIILQSRGTHLHEATEAVILEGSIAGQIILKLIEMQESGVQPSVKKAIHLSQAFFSEAKSKAGGAVTKTTWRRFYDSWSKYKATAHLWAAVYFLAEEIVSLDALAEAPLRFAALAHAILDQAKSLGNKNLKGPIIDLNEMWTMPDEIELPPVQMRCHGLSDEQKEVLKEYSARKFTDY